MLSLKCVLLNISCLVMPIFAFTLFAGDSCESDGRSGNCVLLSECQPLLAEIQSAGTPIPVHLRNRLQKLTCGFETKQPLVCCIQTYSDTFVNNQVSGLGIPTISRPIRDPPSTFQNDWPRPTTTDSSWQSSNHDGQSDSGFVTNNWNQNNQDQGGGDRGDSGSNSDELKDVENHRNLRLLPTKCGAIVYDDKIFGGNRTSLYEMPWMALLAYSTHRGTEFKCGGTVISRWYVLTAAHCVAFLGSITLSGVVLGEYDVRTDPDCTRTEGVLTCAPGIRNISIESVMAHDGYSPQNLNNDIALIRLAEPADFTLDNIKPICLPVTRKLQTQSLVGSRPLAVGWGSTEDGLQSPVLLKVDLPVISNEDCQKRFNGVPHIYNSQLCAGGEANKDSCSGDSGGPLILEGNIGSKSSTYIQRGLVSFGSKRCGMGGFPGVYTRISHYMKWILDRIQD